MAVLLLGVDVDFVYRLEGATTGGGVNAVLAIGLLIVLTAGGAARVFFGLFDRLTYAIERRAERRRAAADGLGFEAKPFPATDSRAKLGLVWVLFMLGCLGSLAVIRAVGA